MIGRILKVSLINSGLRHDHCRAYTLVKPEEYIIRIRPVPLADEFILDWREQEELPPPCLSLRTALSMDEQ